MVVGRLVDTELPEDVLHVGLDRLRAKKEPRADALACRRRRSRVAPCERAAQAGQDDVCVLETALAAASAGLVAPDLCDALPERREPSLEE
jgi:hypothetical protein